MTDMTVAIPGAEGQDTTTLPSEVKTEQRDITTPQTVDATPDAGKTETGEPTASGDGKQEKKEPSQSELNRRERNRERWAQMKAKAARYDALQSHIAEVRAAEAPDWSKFADPNEEVAERMLHALQQKQVPSLQKQAESVRGEIADLEVQSYNESVQEARTRYPDFDSVVYNPNVPFAPQMVSYVANAERGADVAYYLGKNPDVAQRLAESFKIGDALGYMELGRIEAKMALPSKSISSAPKPASVIQGGSNPPGFDVGTASVSEMADFLKKSGIIR